MVCFLIPVSTTLQRIQNGVTTGAGIPCSNKNKEKSRSRPKKICLSSAQEEEGQPAGALCPCIPQHWALPSHLYLIRLRPNAQSPSPSHVHSSCWLRTLLPTPEASAKSPDSLGFWHYLHTQHTSSVSPTSPNRARVGCQRDELHRTLTPREIKNLKSNSGVSAIRNPPPHENPLTVHFCG